MPSNTYNKYLIQTIWSVIMLLIVILSNNIDSEYTNRFSEVVVKTINYDLKIDDKRIVSLREAITAFNITSEVEEYITPIQGTLYKRFNENKTGIDVLAYEEFVKSIGYGEVLDVSEKESGIEAVILHGELNAVYSNMKKANVKKGEKIVQGHIIGSMGDVSKKKKYFHFELWKDKSRVDPLEYIKINDKIPLSYE